MWNLETHTVKIVLGLKTVTFHICEGGGEKEEVSRLGVIVGRLLVHRKA